MTRSPAKLIADLVRKSMEFHHMNKRAESKLGVSLIQYHVLRTLKDQPCSSPQALAVALGTHPSSLTQSLKRLAKRELIFVEEDPRDSRRKLLGLTLQGDRAVSAFESGFEGFFPRKDW